ncbi:hypothetical protein [Flavobacterium aquidurense]|uniref:hypothetical protein n=1 Tax=Flavobacterium aquidurense TaxID=362413 RepID=UPI00285BDE3B|nr:hypothetical protein [Flavobacterium aquidurense]MDR7369742.1 hypothetical protein [Flavobacterium aquidurense]
MSALGSAAFANDCSKLLNDCSDLASSEANWDEVDHGCLSDAEWHQAYCGYYNDCISH